MQLHIVCGMNIYFEIDQIFEIKMIKFSILLTIIIKLLLTFYINLNDKDS